MAMPGPQIVPDPQGAGQGAPQGGEITPSAQPTPPTPAPVTPVAPAGQQPTIPQGQGTPGQGGEQGTPQGSNSEVEELKEKYNETAKFYLSSPERLTDYLTFKGYSPDQVEATLANIRRDYPTLWPSTPAHQQQTPQVPQQSAQTPLTPEQIVKQAQEAAVAAVRNERKTESDIVAENEFLKLYPEISPDEIAKLPYEKRGAALQQGKQVVDYAEALQSQGMSRFDALTQAHRIVTGEPIRTPQVVQQNNGYQAQVANLGAKPLAGAGQRVTLPTGVSVDLSQDQLEFAASMNMTPEKYAERLQEQQ